MQTADSLHNALRCNNISSVFLCETWWLTDGGSRGCADRNSKKLEFKYRPEILISMYSETRAGRLHRISAGMPHLSRLAFSL